MALFLVCVLALAAQYCFGEKIFQMCVDSRNEFWQPIDFMSKKSKKFLCNEGNYA